jgi:hypothetical protein
MTAAKKPSIAGPASLVASIGTTALALSWVASSVTTTPAPPSATVTQAVPAPTHPMASTAAIKALEGRIAAAERALARARAAALGSRPGGVLAVPAGGGTPTSASTSMTPTTTTQPVTAPTTAPAVVTTSGASGAYR